MAMKFIKRLATTVVTTSDGVMVETIINQLLDETTNEIVYRVLGPEGYCPAGMNQSDTRSLAQAVQRVATITLAAAQP